MGLNVSTAMCFENHQNLGNTARQILNNKGASKESAERIVEKTIFNTKGLFENSQLSIIKASEQISANATLDATLRYLKNHAVKKVKKTPVFGELWETLETKDDTFENNKFNILIDFEIDNNIKNIFAA